MLSSQQEITLKSLEQVQKSREYHSYHQNIDRYQNTQQKMIHPYINLHKFISFILTQLLLPHTPSLIQIVTVLPSKLQPLFHYCSINIMRMKDNPCKMRISALIQEMGRKSRPVRDSEPPFLVSARSSQFRPSGLSPHNNTLPHRQLDISTHLSRKSLKTSSVQKPKNNIETIINQMKRDYPREPRISNMLRAKSDQEFLGLKHPQPPVVSKFRNSLEEIQEKISMYSRKNRLQTVTSPSKLLAQNKSSPRPEIDEKAQKCKQLCLQLKKKLLKQTVSTTSTQGFQRQLNIQQFALGRLLGEGKFSKVYLARHIRTGLIVAIKMIRKETIRRQRFQDQLTREISIQSYFNHVNLVRLYGYFSDQTNVYLIIEYCPGGQLYDLFRVKGRLREEEWVPIMKGISEGLYVLHLHDVIHRDLKPQNVMMAFAIPKLGDFGWAVHSPRERRVTFCGTPLYISPQLLTGGGYDQQVDVWALGIMSYQFLTGRIPFRISQDKNLLDIVNSIIVFPKTLSPSCLALLEMVLNKDPDSRIGILNILEHPFLQDTHPNNSQSNFIKGR